MAISEDERNPIRRPYHRFFGLILTDQLQNTPFQVELEFDMSVKKQMLDVLVVRRTSGDRFDSSQMPDGLTDLVDFNLITFKSHHESLNEWAIEELIGHFVNYRKIASDATDGGRLQANGRFKTFAVCARRPAKLFQQIEPKCLSEGVYEILWGVRTVRIVVANELPEASQNAMVLLFSAAKKRIEYGAKGFRRRSHDISTVINELFLTYTTEGISMPYTMDDFHMELIERLPKAKKIELVQLLKPEERLHGLKPEERLQGLTLQERFQGLTKKEIQELLAQYVPENTRKPKKKRNA